MLTIYSLLNVPSCFYDITLFSFSFQMSDLSSVSLCHFFSSSYQVNPGISMVSDHILFHLYVLSFRGSIHSQDSSTTFMLLIPKCLTYLEPWPCPRVPVLYFNLLLGISILMSHYHIKSSMLVYLFTTALPLSHPEQVSLPSFPASQYYLYPLNVLSPQSWNHSPSLVRLSKFPQAFICHSVFFCQNSSPGLYPLTFELLPHPPDSLTASSFIPHTTTSLIFFKYNFHHIAFLIKVAHDSCFLLHQV